MSLYTKTGDTGETSLLDGSRVSKDDVRVAAYGTVDELNSVLGWCRAASSELQRLSSRLAELQQDLFCLGSELAAPGGLAQAKSGSRLDAGENHRMESWIDEAQTAAPGPRRFVLPGGTELASRLHIARTCCRRAERCVVNLHRISPVRPEVLIYLNRLSDLLFAWALWANQQAGQPETAWDIRT